jgi:hypothetical protein
MEDGMHYTRDYKDIPEGPARDLAAVNDCRDYLDTTERFNEVVMSIRGMTEESAAIGLSFTGIQGFPARALWRFSQH